MAIRESIESDIRRAREKKEREEAAGDEVQMEEDEEEEDPVPVITRFVLIYLIADCLGDLILFQGTLRRGDEVRPSVRLRCRH